MGKKNGSGILVNLDERESGRRRGGREEKKEDN